MRTGSPLSSMARRTARNYPISPGPETQLVQAADRGREIIGSPRKRSLGLNTYRRVPDQYRTNSVASSRSLPPL